MGPYRLRVEILKWQEENAPKGVCLPKDDSIMSWLEPCPGEMTIGELMVRISTRFEEIHVGKGKLGMKWLRDGYGDILTSTLAVKDCFRDRSDRSQGEVDPKEWTVQVGRAKPAQHELQNPLRFASLAPESSARARSGLVNSTLQQAVAGRRSQLQYVRNDREISFFGRRAVVYGQATPLDPDRPIRSRERDFPKSTQRTHTRAERGDDAFVVADSQPSPEQNGASYGTPQSLSLPSPRDGLTANTSILVDLSDSPVRNEDSGSPKSEIQEAEMLINQIPATRKEDTLESITQTQLDSDGFRKPALPPKATIGITRSPIVSSKATASRYAPLKRPNQSSGRYSPLGPVETDIESSQELPPLKRTKLAPPRRNSFAEPKSFNSINQGAQDMTMRDHISPDLMDEPLRGWPSRNGYVLEPQPTTMQEDPAQGSRLRKGAGQTRTSLFKMNGETQNTVSSSYTAADWKSSGLLPNYESGSERLYPGQHDLVGQDGFDPISTNNRDNTDAGAAVNRPQSQVEACDTFDIPSSPSPELPTSAQASTKARLNVSGPRSKGSNQVRDRKSGFSRTSPRDGSLENQAVNVTRSPSLPNRRPDSFPARTPQKSSWKMGKEDASEEGRDETRQERSSERRNRRQEPVTNSDSAMESRGASTITESSAIQTQSRPRDITPAKKTNLEVPSHISSILRTSNSQDRRLGTSVSFADDCEEPAIDPSPSHQSACFVPVNLPQERKSEETLSSNSRILERIKGGFKGVSRSSDSTTEKMNPLKKLVKGKERAQEPRESLSPRPKVANRISNDTLDNDEYWEPYTIDGNRGPSRNPGMAKWQCPSNTSESGVVESNPQILHPPNTVKVTKRAQSISSIRTESSRGSSGSSTPRSPAKEIVSPALGNSVEASVIEGSTSRSESEDSGLEGSEKAVEAQEEASQFVHKPPINDSSEPNGPITANLSVDIPLKNNSPGAGGSSQNAHNHWSSEDEPEDHAEEDDAAELQLQSENRRSMELGSSQKKLDTVQSPPSTKEPRTPALRRKSSRVSQAKARNPPKQAPKAKLPVSTNPPRPFNGRFVGVSALNAKSKTNGTSHKSLSNSTRTGPSNCSSVAKAVQIDSPDVSDSSSSDDSEVEIKADSKGRQSRNKALEGLISVQNLFANGKKAPKR